MIYAYFWDFKLWNIFPLSHLHFIGFEVVDVIVILAYPVYFVMKGLQFAKSVLYNLWIFFFLLFF